MTVQEACEAPSFKTNQMYSSFGKHERSPGALILNSAMPPWNRKELTGMGYKLNFQDRTRVLLMLSILIGSTVVFGVVPVIMERIMVLGGDIIKAFF